MFLLFMLVFIYTNYVTNYNIAGQMLLLFFLYLNWLKLSPINNLLLSFSDLLISYVLYNILNSHCKHRT